MKTLSDLDLERLQERLGYTFGDRAVLLQSLTHKSYGHEFYQDKPIALRDNERLEFLGDAILDLAVSEMLFQAFPNANEELLSKLHMSLVCNKTLIDIATSLCLEKHLFVIKGKKKTSFLNVLSDALEALIAAVYLDGGIDAAKNVIRRLFGPIITQKDKLVDNFDQKIELQKVTQSLWNVIPTYNLIKVYGPDHAKVFEVEVKIDNKTVATAAASRKKEAEQKAARIALLGLTGKGT